MTPEDYTAAVKACARIAWVSWTKEPRSGYATWCDGEHVEVVPDDVLSSEERVRHFAALSSPKHLYAANRRDIVNPYTNDGKIPEAICAPNGNIRYNFTSLFFGEIPSEDQLLAYFVDKHGSLRGLNRLFPRRILKSATVEWIQEQLEQQRAQHWAQEKEKRVRDLWERYYCMFDERHVSAMSGAEFERFVGKLYTRLGYAVSLTQGGADQGVDLILCKDGHKIAVQAKRWAVSVGNKAVQEAIAGKLYYGCSHAWIVTSSTFSVNAVALAAKDPTISLVDGRALSKLCEQFRTVPIPNFSWGEWETIKDIAERFA